MTERGKGWISAARRTRQVRTFVMEFRILGPFEVVDDGRVVLLGGSRSVRRSRSCCCTTNRSSRATASSTELWGDRPPATALQSVRVHVSQIRKALGSDSCARLPPATCSSSSPTSSTRAASSGSPGRGPRRSPPARPHAAAGLLHEALDLWRGPALADFVYEPFAQAEIARLEELRLRCPRSPHRRRSRARTAGPSSSPSSRSWSPTTRSGNVSGPS